MECKNPLSSALKLFLELHSKKSKRDVHTHTPFAGNPSVDYVSDKENALKLNLLVSSLKDYMRQAGEVTYADTHKGRRNEGVIEFRLYSDMKRALEKLDGTEVNGRKIRLIEDRPGARRKRSYSRSRSHSR